MEQVSK